MKPIEIEVLWHTDETRQLADLELNFEAAKLEHRKMTFYNIDAISPNHWDEENDFTNIHSSGDKWIAPYSYNFVKKLIEKKLIESPQ
jgi:hypothetical protein